MMDEPPWRASGGGAGAANQGANRNRNPDRNPHPQPQMRKPVNPPLLDEDRHPETHRNWLRPGGGVLHTYTLGWGPRLCAILHRLGFILCSLQCRMVRRTALGPLYDELTSALLWYVDVCPSLQSWLTVLHKASCVHDAAAVWPLLFTLCATCHRS